HRETWWAAEFSGQCRRAGSLGISLPPSLPHGVGHVPGGSRRMTRTIFPAICVLVGVANAANAQVLVAPDQPLPAGTSEVVQPVMDRMILVHGILDQFEGRTDGRTPDFRWSGEGWVGTDYDKFWVKTEGFRRSNGTVDDGRHEFLYSRAISTYFDLQGGLRGDVDSHRNRNWAAFGFEGLAPLFFHVEGAGY